MKCPAVSRQFLFAPFALPSVIFARHAQIFGRLTTEARRTQRKNCLVKIHSELCEPGVSAVKFLLPFSCGYAALGSLRSIFRLRIFFSVNLIPRGYFLTALLLSPAPLAGRNSRRAALAPWCCRPRRRESPFLRPTRHRSHIKLRIRGVEKTVADSRKIANPLCSLVK
jgi:hypothetical protein